MKTGNFLKVLCVALAASLVVSLWFNAQYVRRVEAAPRTYRDFLSAYVGKRVEDGLGRAFRLVEVNADYAVLEVVKGRPPFDAGRIVVEIPIHSWVQIREDGVLVIPPRF